MSDETRDLQVARQWLELEMDPLDRGIPAARNIVTITLEDVRQKHGHAKANELIDEFELHDYGFNYLEPASIPYNRPFHV